VVTSTFGAMFAPDQPRTARELLRVLRPGGRLGLASWTPQGWVGQKLRLNAEVRPLPDSVPPPVVWGTREGVERLLAAGTSTLTFRERAFDFVHRSGAALHDVFAESFGPTATALAALDDAGRAVFRERWVALAEEMSNATDGTLCIPATYLEVVAVKG
jgi:SAM-dependent methyltransferase